MKIRITIVAFLFIALSMNLFAQNNEYPTIGDVRIYNYSPALILQRNTSEGGFVQGVQTKLYDGTNGWFFGTLHGSDFRISKGDYQDAKLVVASNGNVGIGTTLPLTKLHIEGASANWNETTPGGALGTIHLSTGNSSDHFGNAITWGASDTGGAQAGIYTRSDGTYGTKMYFATTDSYAAGSKTRLFIDADGKVGIGTTAPTRKLHVGTTTSFTNADPDADIFSSGGIIVNGKVSYDNSYYVHAYQCFQGATEEKGFLSYGYYGHEFKTRQGSAMVIRGDNNYVGIGTTTPQNKLDVAGTIRCTEVKVVALPWADFVFHPSYKLRTLGEVEQFIKTNSHLPEIPTEAEVKDNGINVGEMNAKLLQKVEELTLYMIEMQKKMVDQQKQIDELKAQKGK